MQEPVTDIAWRCVHGGYRYLADLRWTPENLVVASCRTFPDLSSVAPDKDTALDRLDDMIERVVSHADPVPANEW